MKRVLASVAVLALGATVLFRPSGNGRSIVRITGVKSAASTASAVLAQSAKANRASIQVAQVALAKSIQEEGVSNTLLKHFYNQYQGRADEARLLAQFPPKTAEAFRDLHTALNAEIQRQMAAEGKDARFFQAPVEKSMPPNVVSHAIALERLSVSDDVNRFIDKIAHASQVTNADIRQVAELCSSRWPCIEKAAYTWIKSNHLLSPEQHQLIQKYNVES